MNIYTHPNNKKYLDQIRSEARKAYQPIRLDGFGVIFSEAVPELVDSKTKFTSCDSKFIEYNTTNPSDWELYFGFVKPEKEPNFVMIDDRRFSFMSRGGPVVGSSNDDKNRCKIR
jgi:hypothetical protein